MEEKRAESTPLANLENAPAIVQWGFENIGDYGINDYDEALRRAFFDERADFLVLDSFPHNQKFKAAGIAWAMLLGLIYCDGSVDESQSEVSSFRLTDAGRERYLVRPWPAELPKQPAAT